MSVDRSLPMANLVMRKRSDGSMLVVGFRCPVCGYERGDEAGIDASYFDLELECPDCEWHGRTLSARDVGMRA